MKKQAGAGSAVPFFGKKTEAAKTECPKPKKGISFSVLQGTSFFLVFSILFILGCSVAGYRGKAIYTSILAETAANVNLSPAEKTPRTVILDAGHGGMDAGAVGIDGVLEKDLNLTITLQLRDLLKLGGYDVLLTRDCDEMLGDGESGHAKMKDLQTRLDLAKANPDAVFLSIHMNKFPDQRCSGATVYYGNKSEESQRFGNTLRETILATLQPDNKREMKKATSAIYLLDRIPGTCALLECGFLSNAEESARLQTEEEQKKIALTVAGGLYNYFSAAAEETT